ncbi:MAG: sialidase family protein [Dehalococcoidia bacterium]
MRTLSSTLLSAQRSTAFHPYLKVELDEALPGVAHPVFSQIYSGSEPASHHAVHMPSDGSLIRARVDSSDEKLYVQRVVNPSETSDYSQWTFMNTAAKEANICLCGQGSQVLLIYVDDVNNKTMRYRESTDNGATWSSEKTVVTPANDGVLWVAADVSLSGRVALFYGADDEVIYIIVRTGSSWGNPLPWPHSNDVTVLRGISCAFGSDWNLVVCGDGPTSKSKVWTVIYGDGGDVASDSWSSLIELTLAESNAGVQFSHPFLANIDTFRLFFLEKFTGTASYQRPFWSFTPPSATYLDSQWREPVPFNLASSYGVAVAGNANNLWLSTSSRVWRGPLVSTLDLTEDVLEANALEAPTNGGATIVLRNDDGRYNNPGSGSVAALRKGSRVRISPGYSTSQGVETSLGPSFWVQGLEHRSFGGGAQLVLHLEDGWSLLQRWRARRQYNWDLGTTSVKDIVAFILARTGLEVSIISSSTTLTDHLPAFTIHPNSNGAGSLGRLMETVPDTLLFRGDTPSIKYLQDSDPVDYSYGTDHPVFKGSYLSAAARYNRIQTYGNGVLAEAFGWSDLDLVTDRLLQIHDLNLDTQAKAQERSDSLLEVEERRLLTGIIEVPVNCGQELYDLIEVTDSRAGLVAAKRRIVGIHLLYSRGPGKKPQYTQTLSLVGV